MQISVIDMQVKLYHIPLNEVMVDSLHGLHTHFDLITVTLIGDNGVAGTGYTYTGGRGGHAIAALIDKDLRPYILNVAVDNPGEMTKKLDKIFHYIGRGGILSFSLSAIDIALWDVFLKTQNRPLCKAMNREPRPVCVYYGGIDLGYTDQQLLQSIRKAMDSGHTGYKIKVGRKNWREDVDRIQAVRSLVGGSAAFMIDANMVWSVEETLRICDAVKECNLLWVEEPMNPDDLLAYRELSERCPIPIAMGENLHTVFEHRNALRIGNIKFAQPDASNVLGITGWLEVAHVAQEFGVTVNPHGMQELHVNLMAAIENGGLMEFHSFPIHEYTTKPLSVQRGLLEPCLTAGIGVNFDLARLSPYEITKL